MEKTDLNFKPITDGLGFHPFSDGLPYAPIAKSQARVGAAPTIGSGAVAAGPPRVAYPSQILKPAQILRPDPLSAPAMPGRISVPTVKPASFQPAPPQPAPIAPEFETGYGIGYLVKRFLAYSLDSVLNLTVCAAVLSSILLQEEISPELLWNPGVIFVAVLFLSVFNWALITAQEVAFGTSIGKRIFGLFVRGTPAALFLRAFFFLPSLGFCGIGLLWAVIDSKRRCWHDMIVDVQPMELAEL